jgi:hypothetical protein
MMYIRDGVNTKHAIRAVVVLEIEIVKGTTFQAFD